MSAADITMQMQQLKPLIEQCVAERDRLRAALAASQQTVKVLGEECRAHRNRDIKTQIRRAIEATNADPAARAAVEGAAKVEGNAPVEAPKP